MERSLCPLLLQKALSALAFPWRQSGRCAVWAASPPRKDTKLSPLPEGCIRTWIYLVLTLYLNPNEKPRFILEIRAASNVKHR